MSVPRMRVFVTGATGVLGQSVVRLLVEAGEVVRGLSRSQKNASTLRAIGAEPVEADLFKRESLYRAMKDCDAVLHLATKIPSLGGFRSRAAWKDNDRIRRDGTRSLVDATLELEVNTLVYPSVCFLYPDCGADWIGSEKVQPVRHLMTDSTMEAEEQVGRFAPCYRTVLVEELLQEISPLRLVLSERLQPGCALLFGKGKHMVQVWTDFPPPFWSQCRHGLSNP